MALDSAVRQCTRMTHTDPVPSANVVAAGAFGAWLAQARAALRGNGGSDVPCGDWKGGCPSRDASHVRPEDSRTWASVPASVLVPAPRLPRGNAMMVPRDNGHCPMYIAG